MPRSFQVPDTVLVVCFAVNPLNILGINFLGRRLSLSITMGCTALFFLLLNICTSGYCPSGCFKITELRAVVLRWDLLSHSGHWGSGSSPFHQRVENGLLVHPNDLD